MHMKMEKSINSPFNFKFGWWWRLVLLFWVWISAAQAQQSYVNNRQLDCDNNFNETDGFQCNGPRSCLSYLTFRSAPPYDSSRSISSLFNSDPTQIARINQVPVDDKIPVDTILFVPVNCSCSGDFYQHNASYTVLNSSENYFTIANNTYQGLTTCQALKAQNPFHNNYKPLSADMDLLIPLRCACPVDILINSGYNYLLSYLITWGDSISSIAETFNVEIWTIYAANGLPYSDQLIFPFTQVLIPLKDPPTAFQTRRTTNCVPENVLVYEIF